MGVVYMAEQTQPVRRKVALKIIKPGMDTKQVIARFEAERQALALMDHPNIARVFDAGATESGRPYFVMELVQRRPDHRLLRPRAASRSPSGWSCSSRSARRCSTPHQKGIIHRDLKPSNILVTLHDGVPRAQGDRLRHRQGDGPGAHREDALHRVRPARRHAAVHEPRAGGDVGAGRRYPQRHLLPGRAPVRALDRDDALRPGDAPQGGARRDAADHPRGGAAEAQHPAQHARRDDSADVSANRRADPRRLGEAGARRAGLDRDEGAGEGPEPPLRDGQRRSPPTCAAPIWTTSRCRRARRRRGTGSPSSPAGTARAW